jgi:uncharacterized protein (DUF2384 family)
LSPWTLTEEAIAPVWFEKGIAPISRQLVGLARNSLGDGWLASELAEPTQQILLSYNTSMRLNHRPRPWIFSSKSVVLKPQAAGLADVGPLLTRIVDALGTNAAARLLGADRAQVSRWCSGTESIGQEMGRRIVDLHDVLTRIMRVYGREPAAMWLTGSEPLLGGARPIDVLAIEGAAPVIRAIDGIAAGAYA